ncbi:Ricin-type beta-trefoil lectin domain protein [Microbacterium hydrocarbonoxydans]|uniref:Ricin-type beta-trefoil lectin domain protein n=1 Tax=Microbacterium hydrocarbonoxydans TaxID=273678 RepID=A0A0M2HW93_9MICO|nr:glycoside hydrolase [Microbacterium hydrocarbonoxydans]KJL48703.1 Ricin-type beta-trefoil lectin domain protein [Microbacterium hydrocarbonoxydans]
MKSKRSLAALGVCAIGAGLLVTGAPAASAAAIPITITPNPGYASDPFEGWGTSLVWFANATGGYPDDVRQDLLDKVFGDDGLNLNIARYNIGGGNATDVPDYLRPGGAVEGWWNPDLASSTYADRATYRAAWDGDDPASYDFDADATQRWWIDALKGKITHWEAFSNSPPYFLTQSGYVSGGIGNGSTEQLSAADMDAFADYLVTVVEHIEQEHGIRFDSLDPFNEPNTNYWSTTLGADGWPTSASRQEGAHIGPAAQDQMIQALAARLAEPGTTTKVPISAMDETNPSIFATNWNAWSDASKAEVDQLNVHTYGTSGRLVVRDIAKSADKPLWMSEVEGDWDGTGHNLTNIENGLGMAGRIVDDLRELEPSAWVFWQPVEDAYNMEKVEDLNWGSVLVDFDCNAEGDSERRIADGDADPSCQVKTNAKYNTVRNFTHYIHPGDALIPSGNAQTTAAVSAAGDGATLVHVNTEASPRDLTIDLSRFGTIAAGATVTPIVTTQSTEADPTSNALIEGAAVPVNAATRSATVTVPGKSVVTLVVSGVSGVSDDAVALRDGRSYQLFGVQSGKALAASGTAAVIRTSATTADAATAQTWTVRTLAGGGTDRHRFALQAGDGRFLAESAGGVTLTSATPEQAASDPALQWISSTTDGARFSILSVSNERVLDVNGQSSADGAGVGLWTSNDGTNQLWTLADTGLVEVEQVAIGAVIGAAAELPANATLVYRGGVERTASVTWNTAGVDWTVAGTKTITGSGTDLFGVAFQATAVVEVGAVALTDPVSLTTYAGVPAATVKAAAPATVPAAVGATDQKVALPVVWDWSGNADARFSAPGVVTVHGTAKSPDGAELPATLSVIVTTPTAANVAPASTASATFTESSSYSVYRTTNGMTADKGWSNWRSGTKNTQDTLTYALAHAATMQSAKIYFYQDGSSNSWPQSLSVEYRSGSGSWTSMGTVDVPVPADGTAPIVEVPMNGVQADAVRVVMTARAATHMIVSEVELYAAAPSPSTVDTLAAITLDGAPLRGFAADVEAYQVPWPGESFPTVRAVAVDGDATVAVTQADDGGLATVAVTSASGSTRTYTLAFTAAAAPDLDAAVSTSVRCVAGKAQLVLTVTNTGEVPTDISVSTPYGSKALSDVQPGARSSIAQATRLASFPAGTVQVELGADADGTRVTENLQFAYLAGTCAR